MHRSLSFQPNIEGIDVEHFSAMRTVAWHWTNTLSVALLMALPATAWSQQAVPQHTAATYGSWTVQCDIQTGPPQQKNCEMAQLAQVNGQSNPIARVAIRSLKGQPLKLAIQVPANVWLLAGVRLQTDDKDPGLPAAFTRCLPGGCFADADIKPDVVGKFRASAEEGKIHFQNGAQQEVVIPLGFKGFAQALDALSKE
jgi:invasion protein IalB